VTTYLVLASIDGYAWFALRRIEASNGDAAITQVRDADTPLHVGGVEDVMGTDAPGTPSLKDPGVRFVAVAASSWKEKQMRKQMVERWALGPVETPAEREAREAAADA
jgi:hypothetical protein